MFKTNSTKRIEKFKTKFEKEGAKLLNNISVIDYYRNFGLYQDICAESYAAAKSLIVTSPCFENISARKVITDTLKAINYKRKAEWTEPVVIAFLDEAMSLYLSPLPSEAEQDKFRKEICARYNVKSHRIANTISTFIHNAEMSTDKYNVRQYFHRFEILRYKYRNVEKLQKDIENNVISLHDRKLLLELGMIEN